MAKLKTAQIEEVTQPEEAQPATTPRTRKPKIVKSDQDEVAQAVEAAHQIVNAPKAAKAPVDRTCLVEGCEGKRYWAGYCPKHSRRFRLYGDPLASAPGRSPRTSKLEKAAELLRQHGWTVSPLAPAEDPELVTAGS